MAFCIQVYLGNTITQNRWGFILYPLSSALIFSLYLKSPLWIKYSSYKVKNFKRPLLAFTFSLLSIFVWFAFLLRQMSSHPYLVKFSSLINPFGLFRPLLIALVCTCLYFLFSKKDFKKGTEFSRKSLLLTFILAIPYLLIGFSHIQEPFLFLISFLKSFLIAGLPEEYIFRFFLLGSLLSFKRFSPPTALLLSSLIFGLWHAPYNIRHMGLVNGMLFCIGGNAFGGYLFGYFYSLTGSLILTATLHALVNTLLAV